MIDDQVNLEELEEMKRQRQAVQEATDDGMPVAPGEDAKARAEMRYRRPKQWVKYARKWIGARGYTVS
jgi:hypothetical protein